jgi:hypothetical protein
MVSGVQKIVPELASAVEARRIALGFTPTSFAEATGLTAQGLAPIRKGVRKAYQERLTAPVCRVLQWSPDSIERIMNGLGPVELVKQQVGVVADTVDAEMMLAIVRRLDAVVGRLEALADQSGVPNAPKPQRARPIPAPK